MRNNFITRRFRDRPLPYNPKRNRLPLNVTNRNVNSNPRDVKFYFKLKIKVRESHFLLKTFSYFTSHVLLQKRSEKRVMATGQNNDFTVKYFKDFGVNFKKSDLLV